MFRSEISLSTSETTKSKLMLSSSFVLISILPTNGASFTGLTKTLKFWFTEYSSSDTSTKISTLPFQLDSGLNKSKLSLILSSPFPDTIEASYNKTSPSISKPSISKLKLESSSISWLDINASTGESLTGSTVKVKEIVSVSNTSVTLTVTLISPYQLLSGVIVIIFSLTWTNALPSTSAP